MVRMYKPGHALTEFIASFDSYAPPIAMSFEQKKFVPTFFGGCLQTLKLAILALWSAISIISMVNVEWNISQWTQSNLEGKMTPLYTIGP